MDNFAATTFQTFLA